MKHTVIVSDVHLCEAVPGDGLWMRYRQRQFFPDAEFAGLFARACAEAHGDELEIVFNGDLFDFDAPAVIDGEVRFDDPPRSEHVAVETLQRILADHSVFVDAIARVLAAGHSVVFVSGNHDAQLAWPAVRTHLRDHLSAAAEALGACESGQSLGSRVSFRTWFHRTSDGIHVEHGNQYDHFCSFRYPMAPYTSDGRCVQPTMGSLSFRHLVSRMGFFNPHVDSSFMLSLPQYLAHWAQYYLRSPHSLAVAWAAGAVRVADAIVRHKQPADGSRAARNLALCADETGCVVGALARHAELFAPPSEDAPFSVIRELWLDRVGLGTLGAAAIGLGAIGGPLLAARLALGVVGAFAAYELATPKVQFAETYARVAESQRAIARIHRARAVVFGHTHQPHGEWRDGVFLGNTGTWSAAFRDIECTMPVDEGRPVIWIRSDESGLRGGLFRWCRGVLSAWPTEREVRRRPVGALDPVIA